MNEIVTVHGRVGLGRICAVGIASVLVGALWIGAAVAADKAAASRYVADAKDYLEKGELRAAEIQIKNALRENPNDVDARVTFGMVALRKGDPGAAERSFKSVLLENSDLAAVLPLLGQSYLMQGKAREILDELNVDARPSDIAGRIADLRARAYIIQKQPEEARIEAEAALVLQPEMPDALLTLALLRRQKGDAAGAESLVDRALRAAPKNVPALDAKGDLRTSQNDPKNALGAYQKALSEHPDDIQARLGGAAALLALGQTEQARSEVDEALKRSPGQPAGLYLRALILERDGKYADALTAIEPVAARLEDALPAQILLGELSLRANRIGAAQAYAQHAVSLDASSIGAKLLLGLIYARSEQPLKVIQLLEPVAERSPDNAQIQMVLGDAYGRSGQFDAAAKALKIASAHNPADSALRTRLNASRIGAGDQDTGLNDLSSLLAVDPKAQGASALLISSMINLGRLAEAERIALELRGSQPDNPVIDNLLGQIHWMTGDWNTADSDFASALRKQPLFLEGAKNLALLRQVRGIPDGAESLYGAVLKADDKNTSAMVALAGVAQAQGNEEGAVTWLERASATAPGSAAIQIQLVELLIVQKKTQKALATAQALDQRDQNTPEIINILARAQLAAGRQDSAIISFRRLAELQSNPAVGQFRLGRTLAFLALPEDALTAYRKAIESDAAYLPAWQALAALEARTSGVDRSVAAIRQATIQKGVTSYSDLLKGEAYLAVGRYTDAQQSFQAALDQAPDTRVLLRLADARSQAGDKAGVLTLLSNWLKTHSDDLAARGAYADALMTEKDYVAAIREYEILFATNPTNIAALNNLAWLYSDANPSGALKYAHLAFGLAPRSPQIADTLAWILLQQGDARTATNVLRLAHTEAPDDPEISYHLATALASAGDVAGARILIAPLAQRAVAFGSQNDAKELLNKLDVAK